MTLEVVRKLRTFEEPFSGNPNYWKWIPGLNIVYNVYKINDNFYCCVDDVEEDEYAYPYSSIEEAIIECLKRMTK